jgi:hypothetical protein
MARLFSALVLVGVLAGFTLADNKTGEVKFTGPNKENVKVSAGDKLKLEVTLKQFDLNGRAAVSVSGKVKNTTDTKMNYSYNVAFLDKDKNLVGCQNFALDVQAGKEAGVGTFIFLPPGDIARIQYYTIAFYESADQIGK